MKNADSTRKVKFEQPAKHYPEVVTLLIEANILVRKLHELLDQTHIATTLGISRQAIQHKAMRIEKGGKHV